MDDRAALRKKLREKIRNKRTGGDSGPQLAQRLKDDPATTMMQMGIDDIGILTKAKSIVSHPEAFMRSISSVNDKNKNGSEAKENNKLPEAKLPNDDDEDDEEAPPPLPPSATDHTMSSTEPSTSVTLKES